MPHASRHASLRTLRWLTFLSVAVPLLLYAGFAVYRFLEVRQQSEHRVNRSLRIAHEHALKVLGGAEALQDRIHDQVQGRNLAQLRASQPELHEMLAARARGQSQIQSIWIIGADGKAVASSRFAQVPATIDFSDRPYFKFHREAVQGRFLSEPLNSRTTGERIMDISLRFDNDRGEFGGVINVSLLTTYFQQFYNDLVADEPGLAINMFSEQGSIYTRWPQLADAPDRLKADSPVMARIRSGHANDLVRGRSSVDGLDRLIAFQKIGRYPLYMGTGMDLALLRTELLGELGILLAVGLAPFLALFWTARLASRRTREGFDAIERLEQETLTRARAEEALLQAQKLEALGRLTGGVAHDFNNALMVISNNAFLLRRNVTGAGEKQVDSISRAVESATKLTRQLLAFSRRQALLPEYVRLQERLAGIGELITPVLGGQVRFGVTVEPDTRPITVDPAELELALLNLGINARDAMPSGGTFKIRAGNAAPPPGSGIEGEAVVIEAIDTGNGIDPAVIDKVFEPFFTTKPLGQGTGLGLSQVYGLCQRAGGAARIRSTPGSGTVVSLYFPAAQAAAGAAPGPATPIQRQLDRSVLLVEDNDSVAGALTPLLEALGCEVVRLGSADAAVEWFSSGSPAPDVVLSDVVMPGRMDGLALAQWLRDRTPGMPVLLMTGYAQQIEAITQLGFEVLPKPCSAEVISAAISRVTAR